MCSVVKFVDGARRRSGVSRISAEKRTCSPPRVCEILGSHENVIDAFDVSRLPPQADGYAVESAITG